MIYRGTIIRQSSQCWRERIALLICFDTYTETRLTRNNNAG